MCHSKSKRHFLICLHKLHITLVLPIVGLDIGAFSSGNSAVLRFGARRIKPSFSSYYLTLSKSQAAVPGRRNTNSQPA
jgi:hypothetical protein